MSEEYLYGIDGFPASLASKRKQLVSYGSCSFIALYEDRYSVVCVCCKSHEVDWVTTLDEEDNSDTHQGFFLHFSMTHMSYCSLLQLSFVGEIYHNILLNYKSSRSHFEI